MVSVCIFIPSVLSAFLFLLVVSLTRFFVRVVDLDLALLSLFLVRSAGVWILPLFTDTLIAERVTLVLWRREFAGIRVP